MVAWQNRGLSLMGRIQVINTLIASLFVYKMMVLPNIPQGTIRKLENMFREYLWDGKKSKVAISILQVAKKNGGLDLVNVKNKEIALKATWPKILSTEQEYASLVYHIMRCNVIRQDIWRCRIEESDIKKLKITNQFWEDVLVAWSKFNCFYYSRYENQFIWYNSLVRIKGKPFMWNDVYGRGLKYIYQLFS